MEYTYWILKRGRYGGHHSITRYCRINTFGHLHYVDHRIKDDPKNQLSKVDLYQIGMCLFLTVSMGSMEPTTKEIYEAKIEEALNHFK